MDKYSIGISIGFIILLIASFGLGWTGNNIYDYSRKIDGLRFVSNNSHISAIQTAQTYDDFGDWVCVNVKGMDFERALEVCNHEVGHEIWAEYCEDNIDKCINLTNEK